MKIRKLKICKYKNCNLQFMPKYGTQKYCSYKCYWKDMKGKSSPQKLPRETRICVLFECCNTFECSINDVKRYCSRICARKAARGVPIIFKNPKERGRKIGKKNSKNMKRNWQDPKYIAKQVKARSTGPNKKEKFLIELLQKLFPDQWKYVGCGDFFVENTCKNPDFIHADQKKIIEHFGDYWHGEERTGISNDQHEQERVDLFAQYGYQTLVIWEHELVNLKKLKKKLIKFTNSMGDKK